MNAPADSLCSSPLTCGNGGPPLSAKTTQLTYPLGPLVQVP
jgi:hypothetical protein